MTGEKNQCFSLTSTSSLFGSHFNFDQETAICEQDSVSNLSFEPPFSQYKLSATLDEKSCDKFCKPSWYERYNDYSPSQKEARFWLRYNFKYKFYKAEPFQGALPGEKLEQSCEETKKEIALITDIWKFLFGTRFQDQSEKTRGLLIGRLSQIKDGKIKNILQTILIHPLPFQSNSNLREDVEREVFDYIYDILGRMYKITLLYKNLHYNYRVKQIAQRENNELNALYSLVRLTRLKPQTEEEKLKNERLTKIDDELYLLRESFKKNSLENYPKMDLPASVLNGFPEYFKKSYPVNNGKFTLELNPDDFITFLDYADPRQYKTERLLALKIFGNRTYPQNAQILEKIIKKGQDYVETYYGKSILSRYKNWADYEIGNTQNGAILENSDYVSRVIERFKEPIKKITFNAYQEVLAYKKRFVPDAKEVEVWESRYWSRLLYEEKYQLSEMEKNESKKYLQPENIFKNSLKIIEDIYKVQTRKVNDSNRWHPDVKVYEIWREKHLIGRIYFDLYKREGKPETYPYLFTYQESDFGRKLPVVVAVANFSRDREFDLEDVATFFHEFAGHGFEKIFKRGSWMLEDDFVEAPSTFFDNFALQREVLLKVLKDEKGNSIPNSLLDKQVKSHHFTRRYRTEKNYWIDSKFLLDFFKHVPKEKEEFEYLAKLFQEAIHAVDPIRNTQNIYSFLNDEGVVHGNLRSFSYKYLLDEAFGLLFLARFRKEGLFNRKTWDDYIEHILRSSGHRYSREILKSFLKRSSGFEDVYDLNQKNLVEPGILDDAIREFEKYYIVER